jgi:hypothetical protein
MCFEEAAALREGDWMRLHRLDRFESSAGATYQVLFDLNLNLIENIQRA